MRVSFATVRSAAAFTVISALICALICISVPPVSAMAAPVTSATDISGSDVGVSGSDAAFGQPDPHFQRVSMIPLNVDIPYFYQEVANISGMYIFTMPDGTVYKRIYGSLDGEFGWYEPKGYDYKVEPGFPIIDTDKDVEMYEDALEAAGITKEYTSDYYGILPPEQGTVSVTALFGRPAMLIYIFCGIVTAVLCLIILISSRFNKNGRK